MKAYIGIDNGVSGSIAFINGSTAAMAPTPVRTELSYTVAKANITRVDVVELETRLYMWSKLASGVLVILERPYVNPKGFKATLSAIRALEAMLICIERVGLPYMYVDSRKWQRVMLPSKLSGAELKSASRDVGVRLFPGLRDEIMDHKDADSLLMAEWGRREAL